MPYFTEVAYIGLPLSGKATSIQGIAQAQADSTLITRENAFSRELVAIIPRYDGSDQSLILRAYPGAVWSASSWEIQSVAADGIVVVLDPQCARHEEQVSFLRRLCWLLQQATFQPSSVPIAFQINKTDLVAVDDPKAIIAGLWDSTDRVFRTCALNGSGLKGALDCCLEQVASVRESFAGGLAGEIGLALNKWSPFRE
jgi:signal recognition particle receptor subunit beta